jgi:hypothetical protein
MNEIVRPQPEDFRIVEPIVQVVADKVEIVWLVYKASVE